MPRIFTVQLDERQVDCCRARASNAELGGASNIHADRAKRMSKIEVDQFVGQLGTLGYATYLYGRAGGLAEYRRGRDLADANRTRGDGGQDIVGANVDVKTSLWRRRTMNLSDHHLLVRPHESHPLHVYVLAIVDPHDVDLEAPASWTRAAIYLVGWATTEELRPPPRDPSGDPFGDAARLKGRELHTLAPIIWDT